MRTLLTALLLAACPAFPADHDFNGRWDINTVAPRPRPWWLQLTGVGTTAAAGKFVSAYNGDMNNIDSIAVENGELKFVIIPPARNGAPARKMIYRARLTGGKLEGTFENEGQTGPPLKWTG